MDTILPLMIEADEVAEDVFRLCQKQYCGIEQTSVEPKNDSVTTELEVRTFISTFTSIHTDCTLVLGCKGSGRGCSIEIRIKNFRYLAALMDLKTAM